LKAFESNFLAACVCFDKFDSVTSLSEIRKRDFSLTEGASARNKKTETIPPETIIARVNYHLLAIKEKTMSSRLSQ